MPQYLLSTHSVEGAPREPMSEERMQELMRGIAELESEMESADALLYSGRLDEPDTAKVVRVEEGETLTTDGPFAATKEHLGGFYIIDAPDLDAAIGWAAKTTACIGRPIEVRPFFDMRAA